MSPYSLFEPHPSVPRTSYLASGRGGAGNIHRFSKSSITNPSPANPPSSRTTLPPPPTRFMTGRGGAGNHSNSHHHHQQPPSTASGVAAPAERAMFRFDEELEREARVEERAAPVYYIGRGGAGNYSYSRGRAWAWEGGEVQPGAGAVVAAERRSSMSDEEILEGARPSSLGSGSTTSTNRSADSDRSIGSNMRNAWSRFSQTLKGGS